MINKLSSHEWLGSFAGRLLQLRPSMHVGTAVQHAVTSIHLAADLDPHQAAELLASATTTSGAAGARSTDLVATHASRYQALFGTHASTQTSEVVEA